MALSRGGRTARPEAGFALIEVVVSALIMVAVTGGAVKLITATGRTGDDQRHRAQAYALAQDDQARMRGIQVSSLNHYERKNEPITVGNTVYKVTSRAFFVNDETAEASCEAGNNSADYVQIASEVDWPGRPAALKAVKIESIVSPATGSLDPTHGALAVEVLNSSGEGISAVSLYGSGPAPFSGSTDSTGCALFPDLPEGNYTLTPSLANGYVDELGAKPAAIYPVGVVKQGTSTEILHYDLEGKIELKTTARGYTGTSVASSVTSLMLINQIWSGAPEKPITPSALTAAKTQLIESLYPFGTTSSYSYYAGSCVKNKPPSAGAWLSSVAVQRNATAAATLQEPAIYPKVWSGRNSSNAGSGLANAEIWATEDGGCGNVFKLYPTNSSGQVPDPGLPWGRYDLCADNVLGESTTGSRVQRIPDQDAKSLTSGPTSNFYLGTGTSQVSVNGKCP